MVTPVGVSPVISMPVVRAVTPAVIAIPGPDDHAEHRQRRSENDRTRRWRRRIVVIGRGCAVRLNHFGARIRPESGSQAECENRQCYYNKFLSHDRMSLLLFGRLNPTIIAKLQAILTRNSPAQSAIRNSRCRTTVIDRRYRKRRASFFVQERKVCFVTSLFHFFLRNEMEGGRINCVHLSGG